MDFVSLSLLAIGVVGLGSAATVLLTKWIPQPVAELAALHGLYAVLGEAVATAKPHRERVQQEAMNVVRTSN